MYAGLVFSATLVKFSAALPIGDAFALAVNQHEYICGYSLNCSKINKKYKKDIYKKKRKKKMRTEEEKIKKEKKKQEEKRKKDKKE